MYVLDRRILVAVSCSVVSVVAAGMLQICCVCFTALHGFETCKFPAVEVACLKVLVLRHWKPTQRAR